MDFPIIHIRPQEINLEIVKTKDNESPALDKINTNLMKLMTKKCVFFLTRQSSVLDLLLYIPYTAGMPSLVIS